MSSSSQKTIYLARGGKQKNEVFRPLRLKNSAKYSFLVAGWKEFDNWPWQFLSRWGRNNLAGTCWRRVVRCLQAEWSLEIYFVYYTFPYIVTYHSCATGNKIVCVQFEKTGWGQFVVGKTNYRLKGTGHKEGGRGLLTLVAMGRVSCPQVLRPSSTHGMRVEENSWNQLGSIKAVIKESRVRKPVMCLMDWPCIDQSLKFSPEIRSVVDLSRDNVARPFVSDPAICLGLTRRSLHF